MESVFIYWDNSNIFHEAQRFSEQAEGDPGAIVLLTGDGTGYTEGGIFHRTLDRMRRKGWRVEILSWSHSCNLRMRRWAEENGAFIALDDFYHSITYLEPSRPGFELAMPRYEEPVDLSRRVRA